MDKLLSNISSMLDENIGSIQQVCAVSEVVISSYVFFCSDQISFGLYLKDKPYRDVPRVVLGRIAKRCRYCRDLRIVWTKRTRSVSRNRPLC